MGLTGADKLVLLVRERYVSHIVKRVVDRMMSHITIIYVKSVVRIRRHELRLKIYGMGKN